MWQSADRRCRRQAALRLCGCVGAAAADASCRCMPTSPSQADLWSIGTILYELLVGRPPFSGANHMQLLRNIERGEACLPGPLAARLSPSCQSLLRRLLQRNPVERLSFDEFFAHPFLTGAPGALAGGLRGPGCGTQHAAPSWVRQQWRC